MPLVYLAGTAWSGDAAEVRDLLWNQRGRYLQLLGNTLLLLGVVVAGSIALALPTAFLTTRSDLPARRLFTLLAVLPLAVPGYLLAYTLISLGGDYGATARLTGFSLVRASGFWGAALVLVLCNAPYLYLHLRAAMLGLNPALDEVARSLNHGPLRRIRSVLLPQLRPALCAGSLLVALHVIGDFGVVSLMRYETFSYALYQSYAFGDLHGAAWLALALILMTGGLFALDFSFLRKYRLETVGSAAQRQSRPVRLKSWKIPAVCALALPALAGVGVPLATLLYWLSRSHLALEHGGLGAWASTLWDSVRIAAPAAILAALLAVPVACLVQRHAPSRWRGLGSAACFGYAIPPLAFGLGLVLASLKFLPALYQTAWILIAAYTLYFLAEAAGPVKSCLHVATPRLEEASRSLGRSRLATALRITLPLLRPGILSGAVLVFLSAMKELPLAFLLAPRNFSTLAREVWDRTDNVDFAGAAPYALTILLSSCLFVAGVLIRPTDPLKKPMVSSPER